MGRAGGAAVCEASSVKGASRSSSLQGVRDSDLHPLNSFQKVRLCQWQVWRGCLGFKDDGV